MCRSHNFFIKRFLGANKVTRVVKMSTATMRVAAVQMTSTPNISENMVTVERLVDDAVSQGAQVVLLPEYWPIFGMKETDKLFVAEDYNVGPIQEFMSSLARTRKIWLIGGSIPLIAERKALNSTPENGSIGAIEPPCEKVFNSTIVYNPLGEVVRRYDKMHLFSFANGTEIYEESRTISAGTNVSAFDVPIGRVGLSICYDLRFPEFFRALGDCVMVVVPAAFTCVTGKAHWELLLRARAVENQCYILASAQVGSHPNGRQTWGHSMLIDPWGEIQSVLAEGQGVVVGNISLDVISTIRGKLPALQHKLIPVGDHNTSTNFRPMGELN